MTRPALAVLLVTLCFAPLASGAPAASAAPPATADEQAGFWAAFGAPRSKAGSADSAQIWATLAAAPWLAIGDPQAKTIVYAFTDTDCVYCHVFWRNIQPWLESGQVQLRYLMVDYLGEHSRAMAAAILMSASPADTLTRYEQHLDDPIVTPEHDIPQTIHEQLEANRTLFHDIGFRVVPGVLMRDAHGRLLRWPGVATTEQLEDLLGPAAAP